MQTMTQMAKGLLIVGGMMLSSTGFSSLIEAKKDDVEIFAGADKGAAVVAKLKKGETATAGDRSGMYWQVKLPGGKSGFVSVLAVKIRSEGGAGINDAIRAAVKEGRTNSEQNGVRSRSAVMGVRGLDDNNTELAGSLRPNLRAVYDMEDADIGKEKLDQQAGIIENDILARMRR